MVTEKIRKNKDEEGSFSSNTKQSQHQEVKGDKISDFSTLLYELERLVGKRGLGKNFRK